MTDYISVIKKQYPDLVINNSKVDENSNFNQVIHVNENLIFRFPRYEDSLKTIKVETEILRFLQGKTTLPVPNPVYTHLDASVGEAFMGYEMIDGKWVNIYELAKSVDEPTLEHLAQQLANFLQSLHSISVDNLPVQPEKIAVSYWADLYKRIQNGLYDKMRPDARKEVTELFEGYLAIADETENCLIHGDFGTGNILYDKTQGFTGVIDFGFVGIGDPAIDYSAIYGFRGRGLTLFNQMLQHNPSLEEMLPRIKFYSETFALQEALHGYENDDPEALQAGLELYV